MTLTFYRIFNKYRICISVFFLIGLVVSFFFLNNLYDITFGFNINAPDIASDPYGAQRLLISQSTTLDCLANVYPFLMIALPVLCFGLTVLFFREKIGLFKYRFVRGESYKKVVLGSMLSHAFINACTFYLIYIVYFTVGYFMFGAHMNLGRTNMDAIFGANFSLNHPFLYFMAEGFIIYFAASFIYSLLASCTAMLTSKVYNIILLPCCFYFGVSLLIGYIFIPSAALVQLLQPFKFVYISLNQWTSHSLMDFLFAICPLGPPLILCIVLIVIILNKGEKALD